MTAAATAKPTTALANPNAFTNAASNAYPAIAEIPTRQDRNTIHGDHFRKAAGV